MLLKESQVWLGRKLKSTTVLTLTSNSLEWKKESSQNSIASECIISSIILKSSNRTFEILYFDKKRSKFVYKEFTAASDYEAQQWCETIILNSNPSKTLPRNLCIITNPISGNKKGKKVLEKKLLPLLNYCQYSYDSFISTHSNYIEELIETKDFSAYTDIICLGGDGTVQQCINSLYKFQPHTLSLLNFGVLQVGSRNALSCELNGKSIQMAIFNILKCRRFMGDIMKITIENKTILATTAVSWGIISDVCNEAQHLRLFGAQRYNVVALKKFFQRWKQYEGAVHFEDPSGQMVSIKAEYIFITVSNHQVPNMHNSEIVMPTARINDGKINLLFMFYTGKLKSLRVFKEMQKSGAHAKNSLIKIVKTNCVTIEPDSFKVFNVDGEICNGRKIAIEILPQYVWFIGEPWYFNEN